MTTLNYFAGIAESSVNPYLPSSSNTAADVAPFSMEQLVGLRSDTAAIPNAAAIPDIAAIAAIADLPDAALIPSEPTGVVMDADADDARSGDLFDRADPLDFDSDGGQCIREAADQIVETKPESMDAPLAWVPPLPVEMVRLPEVERAVNLASRLTEDSVEQVNVKTETLSSPQEASSQVSVETRAPSSAFIFGGEDRLRDALSLSEANQSTSPEVGTNIPVESFLGMSGEQARPEDENEPSPAVRLAQLQMTSGSETSPPPKPFEGMSGVHNRPVDAKAVDSVNPDRMVDDYQTTTQTLTDHLAAFLTKGVEVPASKIGMPASPISGAAESVKMELMEVKPSLMMSSLHPNVEHYTAQIKISPKELGPISAKIEVNQGVATITFITEHAQVKQLMDNNVHQLHKAFEQSTLNLNQVHVHYDAQQGDRHSGRPTSSWEAWEKDPDAVQAPVAPVQTRVDSLVDTYA